MQPGNGLFHMDAKIHKKHQRSLKGFPDSDAIADAHVAGRGFSEESERFFAGVGAKKRHDIQKQFSQDETPEPANAARPDHKLDRVTLQLRREFALLNRIFELREMARDRSSKKLSRKASRDAIKQAKEASATKKPKKVQPSKRTKPSTKEAESKWTRKTCWRCNSNFSIHADWERPPSLCPACSKDINETYLPSAPERSSPVGWVRIVNGGAPGLGKRR